MTENINIGLLLQVLQIAVIVGGGIFALATLRNTVGRLASDIVDVKAELKKLGDVLVTLAVTSKRLDNVEEDVRDLKHGRGFIKPRSDGGINGEYP